MSLQVMKTTTIYFVLGFVLGAAVAGVVGIDVSTGVDLDVGGVGAGQGEPAVTDSPGGGDTTESPESGTQQDTQTVTERDTRSDRAERAIHRLVNEERSPSVPELEYSEELANVAASHSQDMGQHGYFSHTDRQGHNVDDRYARHGINCAGGENIFRTTNTGIGPEALAQTAVENWMNSAGHRENIMRERFTHEGIGVYYGASHVYVTQNFC